MFIINNTLNSVIDVAMTTIEPIIIVAAISLFIYSCTIDSYLPTTPSASDAVNGSVNYMDQSIQATPADHLCVHQITGYPDGECTVPHMLYIDRTDLSDHVHRTVEIDGVLLSPGKDMYENFIITRTDSVIETTEIAVQTLEDTSVHLLPQVIDRSISEGVILESPILPRLIDHKDVAVETLVEYSDIAVQTSQSYYDMIKDYLRDWYSSDGPSSLEEWRENVAATHYEEMINNENDVLNLLRGENISDQSAPHSAFDESVIDPSEIALPPSPTPPLSLNGLSTHLSNIIVENSSTIENVSEVVHQLFGG